MTNALFNSDGTDQELSNELNTLKTRYTKEDGSIDIDGLLTAKAHADRHIKRVESEQAGLREDLKGRATLEEIAERIKAQNAQNSVITEQQNNIQIAEPRSEVDIDKLVDAKLSAYQKQQLLEQNTNFVRQELIKMWGPNFSDKLHAKARELGETPETLGLLAESKPKLFLQLIGVNSTNNGGAHTHSITSTQRTTMNAKPGKSYSDFDKLRKENPSQYWSIATQKELHKLNEEYAARGEDFTKT